MNHRSIYIDTNIKCRTTKLSEENIGENLHDIGLGKEILEKTPEAVSLKEDVFGVHQKQKILFAEDAVKRMKG